MEKGGGVSRNLPLPLEPPEPSRKCLCRLPVCVWPGITHGFAAWECCWAPGPPAHTRFWCRWEELFITFEPRAPRWHRGLTEDWLDAQTLLERALWVLDVVCWGKDVARERSDQNIFFFLITGVERRPHSVRIHRDTFPININTAGIRELAKAKTTS